MITKLSSAVAKVFTLQVSMMPTPRLHLPQSRRVRWATWLQRWLESFRDDKGPHWAHDTGTIHTMLRP
jgi:hypothetical protein